MTNRYDILIHICNFLLIVSSLFPLFLCARTITVKTKSPENNPAIFQYRVPKNYDATRKETYRVLVFFSGRDTDGKSSASRSMGWGEWCDENDMLFSFPAHSNFSEKFAFSLEKI